MTCHNPFCRRTELYAKGMCQRCYAYQWRNDGKQWTPPFPLVTLHELEEYLLERNKQHGCLPSSRKIAAHFKRGSASYILDLMHKLRQRGRLRKVGRRGGARWVVEHDEELNGSNGESA